MNSAHFALTEFSEVLAIRYSAILRDEVVYRRIQHRLYSARRFYATRWRTTIMSIPPFRDRNHRDFAPSWPEAACSRPGPPLSCPYSLECVELEFCELRDNGVLRSSHPQIRRVRPRHPALPSFLLRVSGRHFAHFRARRPAHGPKLVTEGLFPYEFLEATGRPEHGPVGPLGRPGLNALGRLFASPPRCGTPRRHHGPTGTYLGAAARWGVGISLPQTLP